jgi:predicted ATPase
VAKWHLGFPDRAVATMDAGLVLSERLADAHWHVRTLSFAAMLRQWQGNFEAARHWAEAAIAVAREHSIPQWLPMGRMCRGAALARLGQVAEGIAELQAGLAELFQVPRSIARNRSAGGAKRLPRRRTTPMVRDTSGFRIGRVTMMG